MIRFRDFTKLSIGISSFGTACACPKCGRIGLQETHADKIFYVHSETVGFDSNENPVINWDQCSTP